MYILPFHFSKLKEYAWLSMLDLNIPNKHEQEVEWQFTRVDNDRTMGNDFKLRRGRFRLGIKRKFFTQGW